MLSQLKIIVIWNIFISYQRGIEMWKSLGRVRLHLKKIPAFLSKSIFAINPADVSHLYSSTINLRKHMYQSGLSCVWWEAKLFEKVSRIFILWYLDIFTFLCIICVKSEVITIFTRRSLWPDSKGRGSLVCPSSLDDFSYSTPGLDCLILSFIVKLPAQCLIWYLSYLSHW